jgi:histone acetyltransferase 1
VFASQRIQVTILIAPSCKTCSIHINTIPILDTKDGEKETMMAGQKRKTCDELEECPTENRLAGARSLDTDISTQVPPMDHEEIIQRLSKALPKIISIITSSLPSNSMDLSTFDSTKFSNTGDYLDSPIGTIISMYTKDRRLLIRDDNLLKENEQNFPLVEYVFTLADGKAPGVNEYHQQVQKLSLFYIENADEVDLTSDQGGGNWKVLYLFARHHKNDIHNERQDGQEGRMPDVSKNKIDQVPSEKVSVYSLVGYMTLFTFYSPFKKPKSGNVLRICQALILPPFQRQGHGKAMMSCVYDYARGKNCKKDDNSESCIQDSIVEVNVEDPAPGFSYMRDSVDYCLFEELFVSGREMQKEDIQEILDQYLVQNNDSASSWKLLTDHHATVLAAEAKITKLQIQIAYEIHKLARMNAMIREEGIKWKKGEQTGSSSLEEKKNSLFREYRLMVKKRLNHTFKEEIGAHGCSKAEKQAKLSEIFEDTYRRYCSILGNSSLTVPS